MEKRGDIVLKKSFVVITGASRGIGKSTALQFGTKFPPGSVFVLMARNVEALGNVRGEMMTSNPESTVLVRHYDQGNTDTRYFSGIFDSLLAENKLSREDFEQAMVVHNCATIGDKEKTALQLCDVNDVRSYFDINLVGMILLNTSFFATFSDPALSRVIVNMTSDGSKIPTPSLHLYCSGKAARDMFFRVLATEEPSIRILSWSPGAVDTEMLQDLERTSASESLRKVVSDLRQDNQVHTSDVAVADLVKVLEDNTFENAAYVDNFMEAATQILKYD